MKRTTQPSTSPQPGLWVLAASCLVLTLWLTSCASPAPVSLTPQTSAPDPNVLRVGITPNMPPMIFKGGLAYQGVEVDLALRLGAHLGRTIQFVELPWESQIDSLLAGKTDIIMSSMSITTPRQMRISFSKPYMRSGQTALIRRSDANRYSVFLFSDPLRVGIQQATTGDYFVQQNMPRAKRVVFKEARAGAQSLVRKKIDVLVHDAPVNWWLASENESAGLTVLPQLLTEESLAWGLRKEDTALLASVNQFLEQSGKEGSLEAAIRRWISLYGRDQ